MTGGLGEPRQDTPPSQAGGSPQYSPITGEDLPALFRVADNASLQAQHSYLRLVQADLLLLIAGAVFSAISVPQPGLGQALPVVGAALLALSIVVTLVLNGNNHKQIWYGGRAIAESAKTLAWRYMMRAEPFSAAEEESADRLFLRSLRDLQKGKKELVLPMPDVHGDHSQITARMRTVRALPMPERKALFLRDRIRDQRQWYASKGAHSARRERRYFALMVLMQAAALLAAILIINLPMAKVNPIGVFSTAAAAFLTWLQVQRHEELAQSYSVAALELGLIQDQAVYVLDEAAFAQFVADAETAVSREHTLWLARRDSLEGLPTSA
jgi:hypothetical protein